MLKRLFSVIFVCCLFITLGVFEANAQDLKILEVVKDSSNKYYWFFPDVISRAGSKKTIAKTIFEKKAIFPKNAIEQTAPIAKLTSREGVFVTKAGLVVGGILSQIRSKKRKANRNDYIDVFANPNCYITYVGEKKQEGEEKPIIIRKSYLLNIYGAMKEIDKPSRRKRGVVSKEGSLVGLLYPSGSVYDEYNKLIGRGSPCKREVINQLPPEKIIKKLRERLKERYSN